MLRTLRQWLLPLLIVVGAIAPRPALQAHDQFRFVGTLVKVDTARNLVAVKYKEFDGKEETVEVKILASTKITRDGKAIPKSQLKPGLYAVVDALGCDDEFDGVAIKLVPKP